MMKLLVIRDSVISIATHFGLDSPGTESQWGRNFSHLSGLTMWSTPPFCTMGTGSVLGVNWPGKALTFHLHLARRLKKQQGCTFAVSVSLCCLFWGELYVYDKAINDRKVYEIVVQSHRIQSSIFGDSFLNVYVFV
jgi:hypothetical protein